MSDNDTADKPARKPRKTSRRTAEAKDKPAAPRRSRAKKQVEAGGGETPAPSPLIRVPMPVRWRDLDAFNHVNNSKYLSYLEEARLSWMVTLPGQGMDDQVAPVVAAAQLNYRRPIGWPAQVVVELFVERLGNTSLSVGHRIVDAEDAGVLYCDGHVVMVWIDRDSGAAAPLPTAVREACAES
jgi:YbgC/YbaW family acyl-CoA thioester hydrolase